MAEPARDDGPPCPRCEASLYKRHCKYVCPQHGVIYDCSDPFR
ncbi:HVO_2523 family zinc finger protein [Natrialbaceae archaeon A-CW2]|nr:HVO_2523 family zinc finger protein [Natronosalvus amylolyticus]